MHKNTIINYKLISSRNFFKTPNFIIFHTCFSKNSCLNHALLQYKNYCTKPSPHNPTKHSPNQEISTGTTIWSSLNTAKVTGLKNIQINNFVKFENGETGIVHSFNNNYSNISLLTQKKVPYGNLAKVFRDIYIPESKFLLGKVIDSTCKIISTKTPNKNEQKQKYIKLFKTKSLIPPITNQNHQLITGYKIFDFFFPIIESDSHLIYGSQNINKTKIVLLIIKALKKSHRNIKIIYSLIGHTKNRLEYVLHEIKQLDALKDTIIVFEDKKNSNLKKYLCPITSQRISEHLKNQGESVLHIIDDLSHHTFAKKAIDIDSFGEIYYNHVHSTIISPDYIKTRANNKSNNVTTICIANTDDIDIVNRLTHNPIEDIKHACVNSINLLEMRYNTEEMFIPFNSENILAVRNKKKINKLSLIISNKIGFLLLGFKINRKNKDLSKKIGLDADDVRELLKKLDKQEKIVRLIDYKEEMNYSSMFVILFTCLNEEILEKINIKNVYRYEKLIIEKMRENKCVLVKKIEKIVERCYGEERWLKLEEEMEIRNFLQRVCKENEWLGEYDVIGNLIDK